MNERLKKIRKALDLTQKQFADVLHVKQNTVATYEMGRIVPSDSVIAGICREFGVNEIWLRTGEGGDENMFSKISDDDRYSLNLGKLSKTENELVKNMINTIAETSPEGLKYIEEFMKGCLGIK